MISAFGVEHGEISKSFVRVKGGTYNSGNWRKAIDLNRTQRRRMGSPAGYNLRNPAQGSANTLNTATRRKEATRLKRAEQGLKTSPVKRPLFGQGSSKIRGEDTLKVIRYTTSRDRYTGPNKKVLP